MVYSRLKTRPTPLPPSVSIFNSSESRPASSCHPLAFEVTGFIDTDESKWLAQRNMPVHTAASRG